MVENYNNDGSVKFHITITLIDTRKKLQKSVLSKKVDILTRALQRERKAKEIAEGIIENRLRELYSSNLTLEEDISKQQEFQKELIENLVDALIVFDFDMNILNINKEALKLLGVVKEKCPTSINDFKARYIKKLKTLL